MSRYFRVVNLEKFQHYKTRNPPWIKLHNSLTDSYEFGCLQDASKAQAILIWLLASRHDNRLPWDSKWIASRIQATTKVDLDVLVTYGFIEEIHDASTMLAERLRDASKMPAQTEGEGETERETEPEGRARETKREPRIANDEDWMITLQANPAYEGLDLKREWGKCAAWCTANHKPAPSRRRFVNWLNRAERPITSNGHVDMSQLRGMALIEARERQRIETGEDEV